MKKHLLILAIGLSSVLFTARAADPVVIPDGVRAIVASSPYVTYLGAISNVGQTGLRWMFLIRAGFNVHYPTLGTYVTTTPDVSVPDFWVLAITAVDAQTHTLDSVKEWELANRRALFR
jgi:hypothetical protein